jgi:DNA-binding NtrC family response regulator
MTRRATASGRTGEQAHAALVVDPDPQQRTDLGASLRHGGYTPVPAASFEEARRMLGSTRIEVLVVALRLGAFNGLHLVIHARRTQPHVRVLVTALGPDRGAADEAARLGAAYLIKPITRDTLLAAIPSANASSR